MGAVDVWAQITTEHMARQDWLEPLLRWTGQEGDPLVPSPKSTLAAMDAADVDISLLSAWHGPAGDLITNEEAGRQIETAPDRFRGLATVDLNKPMEAVRVIRDVVDGNTFVGVRVVPWLWNLPPNGRRYYPIYAACIDAGVPFCTRLVIQGLYYARKLGGSFPT
ncbi:MAG: amidohydrolase family protein [Candidatus Phaeomarinobacter sp.]